MSPQNRQQITFKRRQVIANNMQPGEPDDSSLPASQLTSTSKDNTQAVATSSENTNEGTRTADVDNDTANETNDLDPASSQPNTSAADKSGEAQDIIVDAMSEMTQGLTQGFNSLGFGFGSISQNAANADAKKGCC